MNLHEHPFAEIYCELREQILSLGFRMTGSREDAEEVLQETFLLVHRHLPQFKGESKVSTWVYRIATRVALNLRKQRAGGAHERLAPEHADDLSAPLPADPLQSREEVQRIQQALQSLSPGFRAVLSLLGIDELTPAEVAEILGIPEGTVWSRASHARRKMRELLSSPLDQLSAKGNAVVNRKAATEKFAIENKGGDWGVDGGKPSRITISF